MGLNVRYHEGLQSSEFAFVADVVRGAVWEEIGYKGRSRSWKTFDGTQVRDAQPREIADVV